MIDYFSYLLLEKIKALKGNLQRGCMKANSKRHSTFFVMAHKEHL